MSTRLDQSNRFARLETPLGTDTLVLVKFEGTEGISENFEWRISALLNEGESPVKSADIIGKPCQAVIEGPSGDERFFPGLCTEIRHRGYRGDFALYELVLRPWTWLLTQETCCEIFHEKKVDDIIKQVFNDRGFSDFKFDLKDSYQPIHYCVQYQETTFDFVSRLMERYGLFFCFEFSDNKHELKVVDKPKSLKDISEYQGLRYYPHMMAGIREDHLDEWQKENRLRTAKIEVDDYNYDKATTAMEKLGDPKDSPSHSHAALKRYFYQSGHQDPGVGQNLADVLIDMERGGAERKFAGGFAPLIYAGGVIKIDANLVLDDHLDQEEKKKHFGVRAQHSAYVHHYVTVPGTGMMHSLSPDLELFDARQTTGSSGGGGPVGSYQAGDEYRGAYELADQDLAYKAPFKTPWPHIAGAQTAVVIKSKNAPDDEEIDVDDQGRILVKFHWYNSNNSSAACSCRVRVSQIWAGPSWGGVWIPRIGQEVVVEFLEGDPDRPLITGAVYNSTNKPPIKFPADKTQSTIKSDSSKGGNGFNELRFEDKKDDEEIYIHAERDRLMEIEHDDDIIIGRHQTEKIGGDRTFELTGGDETVTLKGAPGTKDKYGKMITKGGHRTTTLDLGDETFTVKEGKRTTKIKMDDTRTITDGNDKHTIQKGNQTVNIDKGNQTTTIKLGNQKTSIKAGKGEVDAMQKYEIKVGGSKITMDPMSITIKAMTITIDASMNLTAKGGIGATLQGGASCTVKGGIVMIN
ncbi:MAG: type VI secretion system tip protein TssI/VgrG [Pseudomonadota bacterium]